MPLLAPSVAPEPRIKAGCSGDGVKDDPAENHIIELVKGPQKRED
jgi:hypothetical protein